ncbi:MAG: carboxylesterase/lipase family protein [Alphaproteobacteria bacterium]
MTIVETKLGPVSGAEDRGIQTFKGIPFAAPPVGDLRWAAPQPHEGWQDVRECTQFGNCAMQPESLMGGTDNALAVMSDVGDPDENCLYLNVYTPACDGKKRPVMVWIHGGAFVMGSGSQGLYDGVPLASRGDVVVVTINYRMGALGFLRLKEVTGGAIPSTGNEGLLDQVAGLEWVRDNIDAFGGDASNVTIFGESAGGMSCGNLLAMPSAKGLFQKAIPQSGACHTALSRDDAALVANGFLEAVGVDAADAAALQNLSADKVMEAQTNFTIMNAMKAMQGQPAIGGMPFSPVVDGDVQPTLPIEAVRAGAADGVKIMVGSCLDEWNLFFFMDPMITQLDRAGAEGRMTALAANGGDAAAIYDAYAEALDARGGPVTPTTIAAAARTDTLFRMPAVRLAEAVAARGGTAFNYMFKWKSPAMGGALGACHALELGFVFGTNNAEGIDAFCGTGPDADGLAAAMMDGWINFARTGDPSGGECPAWPQYDTDNRPVMVFDAARTVVYDAFGAERKALENTPDEALGSA